jgi:hypothetical protein
MMKQLAITAVFGFVMMDSGPVDACSPLLNPPPLGETYRKASLVFRGELVAAAPHPTDRCGDETLTFLPSKVWKGSHAGPVVLTNKSVGRRRLPGRYERACIVMCPVYVSERKEYIVFAFGSEPQLQNHPAPIETSHEVAKGLVQELDELAFRAGGERAGER